MNKKTYNPPRDKHLTEAIQQQLKDAQFKGLATGAKTMCATVIKKLEEITEDSSKEDMYTAIEAVRTFCNTALGLTSN
jgi:hypothetical protein